MTSPSTPLTWLHTYEVVASEVRTCPVGRTIIAPGRRLVRRFEFINTIAGGSTWATGERRQRLCGPCWAMHDALHHRVARAFGHDGEHGALASGGAR